jgi:hypothetical protein
VIDRSRSHRKHGLPIPCLPSVMSRVVNPELFGNIDTSHVMVVNVNKPRNGRVYSSPKTGLTMAALVLVSAGLFRQPDRQACKQTSCPARYFCLAASVQRPTLEPCPWLCSAPYVGRIPQSIFSGGARHPHIYLHYHSSFAVVEV